MKCSDTVNLLLTWLPAFEGWWSNFSDALTVTIVIVKAIKYLYFNIHPLSLIAKALKINIFI